MNIVKSITRLRLAAIAGLALTLAACQGSDLTGLREGRVRLVLSGVTDATAAERLSALVPSVMTDEGLAVALHGNDERDHPVHAFQIVSANVTFASVLARNDAGVLLDVAMDLPVTVDVVTMEDGRQIVLPDGELDPGNYDQLVVVMTAVQVETADGTVVTVEPPGGGWTAVVDVCPFTVEDGATTVVGLGFNVRQAFKKHLDRFLFRPFFFQRDRACEVDEEEEEPAG